MQKQAIFKQNAKYFCILFVPQSIGKISLREIFPMDYDAGLVNSK